MQRRPKPARTDYVVWCAIATIFFWQLMVPPAVGLANNGDFGKMIGHFSLGSPYGLEFAFAPLRFDFDPKFTYHSGYGSSEVWIAAGSIGLASIFSKHVDLRFAGAIHAGLILWAMFLLLPVLAERVDRMGRWILYAGIALLLGDVMYVCVCNSYFMDAAALAFFPLVVVMFLRMALWHRTIDAVGFAAAGAFFAAAKAQHIAVVLPVLAAIVLYRRVLRSNVAAIAAAIGVIGAAALPAIEVPSDYSRNAVYTVLFLGLLPLSPNPAQDLAEFHLEPADIRYSGTSAFSPDGGFRDAQFTARFEANTGMKSLARFYSRHPSRAFRMLIESLAAAGEQRPPLGNFDPSAGRPPGARSQSFAGWSGFKKLALWRHGWRYLAMVLAVQSLLIWRWGWAGLALSVAVIGDMIVSGLGDAMDIARHFTVFNWMLDIGVLALLASFLRRKTVCYGV